MGKKTKSKARLDKYYYLAKEHGYRSRAAFKLIQLNKKYRFLESANVLLDLCAAPGGWCQVASKTMPIDSIKIGVDLDPIKPIPGVVTFQSDITSEQCRILIRKEIKHFKADVVLNDGAPNVGGQWTKDSYSQSELVLFAVKLASEFLREGGWFITKVFRSSDYNSLIYVMRQLFHKVEATKPAASRSQAAEIFVVCSGYKAPSSIDNKLLDPKYALKQLEEEDEMKVNTFKSIKAIFDKKRSREGYNTTSLFIKKTFKDFIECNNVYDFLYHTNKITVSTDDCKKYLSVVKPINEYNIYFEDIQLLGKKEFGELVIWRTKIRNKLGLNRKKEDKTKKAEEDEEKNKENEKDEKDEMIKEMDEEIEKIEKLKKKKEEADKKKKEKNELRQKKAYIEVEEQGGFKDNEVNYDQDLVEFIQKNKIDITELKDPEKKVEKEEEEQGEYNEVDLSDLSEDDYINMMNEDLEENMKLYEEEKGIKKLQREEGKKGKKKKDEIEFVRQDEDEKDSDIDNEESESGDDSAYYDSDSKIEMDNDVKLSEDDDIDNELGNLEMENPLRNKQNKKDKNKTEKDNKNKDKKEDNEEDNLSYDTDSDKDIINMNKKKKDTKKDSLLNKKTNRNKEDSDSEKDKEGMSSSEDDGYNTDEKAEIRAIAKKMLRKKERLKIINQSYNRYVFNDADNAPKWFTDDEKIHNVAQKPITKAEVLAEKAYLKKINDRMPKKVLEAKARKKNKLRKRLEQVKKKAEKISNMEEINELSKIKQIEKLYKKEINRSKEKKKYIVSRSFNKNSGRDGRGIKHVDRRLKKDKRAQTAKNRRDKKYKRRKK